MYTVLIQTRKNIPHSHTAAKTKNIGKDDLEKYNPLQGTETVVATTNLNIKHASPETKICLLPLEKSSLLFFDGCQIPMCVTAN